MRFALWIIGIFLVFIAVRVGWVPFVIAARSGDDPMVYGIALQQVGVAALFLIAGVVALVGGCIVHAIQADGGKH